MATTTKTLAYAFAFFLLLSHIQQNQVNAAGCVDNESCTDLCGFAGAGQCVDGKYCKCENCPGRSIYELATLPKICTLDPTCICPAPVLSLTNGKIYTGHRCVHLRGSSSSLVCICFCMPTTINGVIDVIKCPVPKNANGATTPATSD